MASEGDSADRPAGAADGPEPTLVLSRDRSECQVRRFRLTVVGGPDTGKAVVSTGARAVVGSHESCELALGDATVSRFHFEVSVDEGVALLKDLGSRNGTGFDGVGLRRAVLRSGVVLTAGHSRIRFDLDDELVPLPIAAGDGWGDMVGGSHAMRAAFAALERAAASDLPVLIEGETGTGKELAAHAIHQHAGRPDGPFVVVDCGAIPAELLESELFGHERGAFTGATEARVGAFEAAAGGTIFLDEVGEIAPALQPKLLRVLESREVKRVGSNRHQPIDARIVAATNRDLRAEVTGHRFRADLYFRLAVLTIRLPPLRERPEDLPLLVDRLIDDLGLGGRAEAAELRTDGFLAELAQHGWPGNVRELRNYIARFIELRQDAFAPAAPAAAGGPGPAAASGPVPVDASLPLKVAREKAAREWERAYVDALLAAHGGNVSAAARAAGVGRAYLHRLLDRSRRG